LVPGKFLQQFCLFVRYQQSAHAKVIVLTLGE